MDIYLNFDRTFRLKFTQIPYLNGPFKHCCSSADARTTLLNSIVNSMLLFQHFFSMLLWQILGGFDKLNAVVIISSLDLFNSFELSKTKQKNTHPNLHCVYAYIFGCVSHAFEYMRRSQKTEKSAWLTGWLGRLGLVRLFTFDSFREVFHGKKDSIVQNHTVFRLSTEKFQGFKFYLFVLCLFSFS